MEYVPNNDGVPARCDAGCKPARTSCWPSCVSQLVRHRPGPDQTRRTNRLRDALTAITIPEGTPARAVDDTEARKAERAKELAGQGHLLRLWKTARPAERARNVNAGDPAEMQDLDIAAAGPVDDGRDDAAQHARERPGHDAAMTAKVAIITGGSQGIGVGVVAGYRQQGWTVVTNARTIKPSDDPDLLTAAGDIAEPASTDRIINGALERFGRIDTLVNNAGVYLSKPFT